MSSDPPLLEGRALSCEGLSISLPECLDGRFVRMLCAVAFRRLLSLGDRGHIDPFAAEPRGLITHIEQRCRSPIVCRQLQQPFARCPLDADPTADGRRLGYRGWRGCGCSCGHRGRRRCGRALRLRRRRTASPTARPITAQRRSSHSSRCSAGKKILSPQTLPWLRHRRPFQPIGYIEYHNQPL